MTHAFILRNFAPGARPAVAANKAAVQPANAQANANADELPIMDNVEMPANARGGARGSKFFSTAIANSIERLFTVGKPKQGIVIPLMDLPNVKNPAARQRGATKYRIDEWLKENFSGDGDVMPTYTIAVDATKGIVLRRDS